MPLFGSTRDSRLIGSITRELFHKYISIEIEVFKLALNDTNTNIYNESDRKVYYQPVRLFTNVTKEDLQVNDVDTGIDMTQNMTFAFLRDDLVQRNIVLNTGDIIKFDTKYYEIDNVNNNQYFMGRNNETHLMTVEQRDRSFGKNISIKAEAHLTRITQLNLVETYSGNSRTVKNVNTKPKFL